MSQSIHKTYRAAQQARRHRPEQEIDGYPTLDRERQEKLGKNVLSIMDLIDEELLADGSGGDDDPSPEDPAVPPESGE